MAIDNGQVLQGQRYDENVDLTVPYTRQMQYEGNSDAIIGQEKTDIQPNDAHSSLVTVWSAPSVSSYSINFPGTVNLNLPDVLTGVTITYNKDDGAATSTHEVGPTAWVGESGGMNLNPTATASGSAGILPDAQPAIRQYYGQNVPTINYLFYIAGNFEVADVISRLHTILTKTVSSVVAGVVTTASVHGLSLNQPFQFLTVVGGSGGITALTTYYVKTIPTTTTFTYSATAGGAALSGHAATSGTEAALVQQWPAFKPEEVVLTLKGNKVTAQVAAEAFFNYRWNSNGDVSYAWAPGTSPATDMKSTGIDVSVSIRSVRIPPTLHAEIVLSSTSDSQAVEVTAVAEVPAVTGTGSAPSFDGTSETNTANVTANASVTPTTITATTGFTTVPTAGLFIYDTAAEPWKYGLNRVRVILVNFSYFA